LRYQVNIIEHFKRWIECFMTLLRLRTDNAISSIALRIDCAAQSTTAQSSCGENRVVLAVDKTDLSYILDLAVPCAHCGKETFHRVAALLEQRHATCPDCGGQTDLDTEEWTTFLEALKALQPLYDRLMKNVSRPIALP
jgi:hypothetical protein